MLEDACVIQKAFQNIFLIIPPRCWTHVELKSSFYKQQKEPRFLSITFSALYYLPSSSPYF